MSFASNALGPLFPTEHPDRMAAALGIGPGERVLDIGGGHAPLPVASVVVEYDLSSGHDRDGNRAAVDRRFVGGDAQALPFASGAFDFAYASHVFEHLRDPARACRETMRVARRGFIETPRKMTELYAGYPSHRWLVDAVDGVLTFERRWFVESPFHNCLLAHVHMYADARIQALEHYRNLCCVQFPWRGEIPFKVVERPGWRDEFDYDNPHHAAWSHFYFALNLLANGDRWQVLPTHARTALRLLPGEGAFHALDGVFRRLEGDPDGARAAFARASAMGCRDDAVARNLAALASDSQVCFLPLGRGEIAQEPLR